MRMRNHERRRQRDNGLNTISTWTRGTLSGGLLLTGGLGAAFAWTAPGHTAKAPVPQAVSEGRAVASPSAGGTNLHSAGSSPHPTGRRHHTPSVRSTVVRPPVRPLQHTTQPPKTTSGGS